MDEPKFAKIPPRVGKAKARPRYARLLHWMVGATAMAQPALGENAATALFERAAGENRVGLARKTKPVDARPAMVGEIVVTVIRGEGVETQSAPAAAGDMVVRNRCPATGNEAILVSAAKFAARYDGPTATSTVDPPWREYRPRGIGMAYFVVAATEAPITFTAPWGEPMTARAGDIIARDPADTKDIYRIARAAFECTYEIVEPPKSSKSSK